jgi:hypothetical protein
LLLPLALFAIVLALFMLPGCVWVMWLHGRDCYGTDRLGWPLRITLGFIWSFALFSLLGGPFLWCGGTFDTFLIVVCAVWPIWGLASWWLWLRSPASANPSEAPEVQVQRPNREVGRPSTTAKSIGYLLAALYGLAAAACLYSWAGGQSDAHERILAVSPVLLVVGSAAALLLRRPLWSLLRFTAEDETPPPLLWTLVAAIVIGSQAVAASVLFRPDWDDCFNLAAVRDYQESPFLNSRNPISLDPGPVNATHRVLCLELWGSVLCRLTGADPQALFHTFLPGLLVLACYVAYAALIGQVVPRRWVALSLVGLSAYFVFGLDGHYGGANHFLIRIWQGKALLPHLAAPITGTMLLRFARRLDFACWASLVASVCAGLGFSTSAIFFDAALVGCLSLALLPSVCDGNLGGREDNTVRLLIRWRSLRFLAAGAAACLPLAVEALAILSGMQRGEQVGHSGAPMATSSTAVHSFHVWFSILNDTTMHQGCADLLWLFVLPLLGLLLIEHRRLAYPVLYPIVLLFTFANPWLCYTVATYVTSKDAYYRVFWLLPVGPGLGITFALVGRLAMRAMAERARATKVTDRVDGGLGRHLPLIIAGAGGLLLAALPGMFVWGPENNNGPYMATGLGQNLQKMPPDLVQIARRLESDPRVEQRPILSGEEVASFLTPWSSRFRYVMTRQFYLPGFGVDPQFREATEQYLLLQMAYAGSHAEELRKLRYLLGATATISPDMFREAGELPPLPQSDVLPHMADIEDLIRRHRAEYLITSPPLWLDGPESQALRRELTAQRGELLQQLGYEESYAGRDYSLWQRQGSRDTP